MGGVVLSVWGSFFFQGSLWVGMDYELIVLIEFNPLVQKRSPYVKVPS